MLACALWLCLMDEICLWGRARRPMPSQCAMRRATSPRGAEDKARNSEPATIIEASSTSRSAVDDGRLRTAQRVHRSGLDAGPETVAGVGVAVCGHLRVLRVPLHALCSGNLAHIAPATAKHTRARACTRADQCTRAGQCTRGACAVVSSAWQCSREHG